MTDPDAAFRALLDEVRHTAMLRGFELGKQSVRQTLIAFADGADAMEKQFAAMMGHTMTIASPWWQAVYDLGAKMRAETLTTGEGA